MTTNGDSIIRECLIKLLEIKDSHIRIASLRQCATAADKGIHIGGAFSAVIPLVALYYGGFIKIDVENPTRIGQDIFILSKGHSVAPMAAIYADLGYFHKSVLNNSRSVDSILNGHPGPLLPGVHISTGPLGQGLSVAAGFASAGKKSPCHDVYCMTGDGELQEGSVWEAIMYAGCNKLDNLCMIVDRNNGQLDCIDKLHLSLGDLKAKLEAFGWNVADIDGTKYDHIVDAYAHFKSDVRNGKPTAIISNTAKGFGGFSTVTGRHKATFADTLLNQEISLQEKRLKDRVDSFIHFINGLRSNSAHAEDVEKAAVKEFYKDITGVNGIENNDAKALFMNIASTAGKMNLEFETDISGNVVNVRAKEPQVKTRPAPPRSKKVKYDENLLPHIEKDGEYTANWVITETMKVFAKDPKIVSIDSDLASTSGLQEGVAFVDKTRALNAGIAEANMMCMGEAFAAEGCNVWVSTFCPFFEWRALRRIAVGYQERLETMNSDNGWLTEGHGLDITFLATAANLDTQTNGATHMGTDDITVFDGIAHLRIIDVSCPQQLLGIMKWIADGNRGLVYLRVMRTKSKVLYDQDFRFEFGKGYFIRRHEADEVFLVSSGRGVHEAAAASDLLMKAGINAGVVDMPSIDEQLLLSLADTGKPVIFAEQNNGYIWSSFMKTVFKYKKQADMNQFLAINTLDGGCNPRFIHSGTYDQLTRQCGLNREQLAETVRKVLGK